MSGDGVSSIDQAIERLTKASDNHTLALKVAGADVRIVLAELERLQAENANSVDRQRFEATRAQLRRALARLSGLPTPEAYVAMQHHVDIFKREHVRQNERIAALEALTDPCPEAGCYHCDQYLPDFEWDSMSPPGCGGLGRVPRQPDTEQALWVELQCEPYWSSESGNRIALGAEMVAYDANESVVFAGRVDKPVTLQVVCDSWETQEGNDKWVIESMKTQNLLSRCYTTPH